MSWRQWCPGDMVSRGWWCPGDSGDQQAVGSRRPWCSGGGGLNRQWCSWRRQCPGKCGTPGDGGVQERMRRGGQWCPGSASQSPRPSWLGPGRALGAPVLWLLPAFPGETAHLLIYPADAGSPRLQTLHKHQKSIRKREVRKAGLFLPWPPGATLHYSSGCLGGARRRRIRIFHRHPGRP